MKRWIAFFALIISVIGIIKAVEEGNETMTTVCVGGFFFCLIYLIIQLVLYEINKMNFY